MGEGTKLFAGLPCRMLAGWFLILWAVPFFFSAIWGFMDVGSGYYGGGEAVIEILWDLADLGIAGVLGILGLKVLRVSVSGLFCQRLRAVGLNYLFPLSFIGICACGLRCGFGEKKGGGYACVSFRRLVVGFFWRSLAGSWLTWIGCFGLR